ncbi:gamma-glutamyltranspeptidase/glutathione hydrolase [Rhizobium skierniewicense]|uniref:Gamma-glutamyltranspeptidase/glutathione hydrolase n=1 Tax=Rhizobium skierniewicense TaxID=984260 RepID=A0A7W6G116_9HYPH|nr:gamma-glutamyltransferase [Rhizobium skierniewicense]MBB3945277.1 gamma-glutamyltranspeptidase/glutathione hydrolase [Rhizobium skierniewicense]
MENPQFDHLRVERSTTRKSAGVSERGVVTSQHFVAAEAGAAVLRAGGNAVDAAVTAAFTLQTVEPWMTSLAACGYMLVAQPDGTVDTIEFTGRVPSSFDAAFYKPDPSIKTFIGHPASVENRNVDGFTAAVIPGCVRGFAQALKRYGTIGFDAALAPAIERARKGLVVDWHTTLAIAIAASGLAKDEGARSVFLPDGYPPEPGTVLPLKALVGTLETLASEGPDALYGGSVGQQLIADMRAGGSFMTLEDLVAYEPLIYPARKMSLQGKTLHVAGDTSAGQRLFEALSFFDEKRGAGPVDARFFTTMSYALWEAFGAHRRRLNPAETTNKTSTTQVNAVDSEGRMVAITFTLLNRFGARAMSPSTGILLNNGMSWFDPTPGRANSLTPNAYASSNMCPVVVTDPNGTFAAYGAAGGNQIVPSLAQLTGMIVHAGMDIEDAMNMPRMTTGPHSDIIVNVDMPATYIAALSEIASVRPAAQVVFPRPFAAPGMIGRRGERFIGMADTSYPAAFAAVA